MRAFPSETEREHCYEKNVTTQKLRENVLIRKVSHQRMFFDKKKPKENLLQGQIWKLLCTEWAITNEQNPN